MSSHDSIDAPRSTHTDEKAEYKAEIERANTANHVDINHNLEAKIKNPLAHLSYDNLMRDADRFAKEHGLEEHTLMIRKGALVAQNPDGYEDITGPEALTEDEILILRDEVLHKWRQPYALYLTIFTCSIGAAVQGWDQEGSNGANLSFPAAFGIDETTTYGTYIVGLINAAPYIGSAFIGCWISDPLNNYIGRRGTIFFSGVFCFFSVIGSALTQNWYQLFICRILLGIGMGAKGSTVPIYAAENSPASIRGALVMSWQMWTAFGIFLGVAANLAVAKTGDISWRLQLGSAFIPAVPLLIGIYMCPESPRWYLKKRRHQKAWKSLMRLRAHPIQVARDIFYISTQLDIEHEIIGETGYFKRLTELFTIPRVRRATVASFTVMIAQQMCGINIIAFYSSTVFKLAGATDYTALWASFGFGLVNFIFAFPALWTIDTFGRRNLLLFTFPNMAWSLLVTGLCSLLPEGSKSQIATMATFIYIFAAFYSPGEGPVPFTYSAEVFPLSHRELGMGWAVATCLFWAAVLSISFPAILKQMDLVGAFCLYAGFNMVAFVMIFFLVPETKQRSLEELDYIFAVPTRTHAHYQLTKALPYFVQRWILFRKNATLEPLYRFEHKDQRSQIDHLRRNDALRAEAKRSAEARSDAHASQMPKATHFHGEDAY